MAAMSILSRLRGELERHFAPDTLTRARPYALDGSILHNDVHHPDAHHAEVTAVVQGSGRATYVVHLSVAEDVGGDLDVFSACSCPVRFRCKHAAAVGLSLAGASQARTWAEDLEGLLEDLSVLSRPDGPRPGVALQFGLARRRQRHADPADHGRLQLRPLRPGARQPWVKSGLAWSDVAGALARGTYDLDQLRVLDQLQTSMAARGRYYYAGEEPDAGDFGRSLVPLLRAAQEAGVTFVPLSPVTAIEVSAAAAGLQIDAARADGATALRVGIAHGDRLWSGEEAVVHGEPAHTVVLHDGGQVLLAALDPPLSGGPLRALRRAAPLLVPDEAGADLPTVLGRFGGVVPLGSRDGTVALPEALQPYLRVRVSWISSELADVHWCFVYGPHPPVPIDAATSVPGGRDRAAERALLALPQPAPEQGELRVTGVDALHLALLQLPAWRAVEGLEVVEVDAPHFREADEAPEITFTAPETSEAHTDWLDLEVSITVEGERVPLATVLAALTTDAEYVVLPSGLFVRADRPEFAALDDVVRAAAQLHQGENATVRVGRQDLGLWAQLADLGVVDAQADAWVARARALRDLSDLPRPEPEGVVSTLRDYQRDGFHWLTFLWDHGLGGILADEMGLGKTLQVLALVAHARAREPGAGAFLVVAPTSVVSAWQSEAARHTPGLRVHAMHSTLARSGLDTPALAELATRADVVVTTYTLLRLDAEAYGCVAWGGLVLDEAQWIKNHQSRAYAAVRGIQATFRLAVTGTPFENRLLELWSLLSVVTPGLYPHPRSFVTHVVTPVEKHGDEAALRRFTRRIQPFVLRRSKELVAAELPPKQEQVLEVDLSPAHRRVYDTHLARERQRILGLVDDFDRNRVAILAALTRLRQLALDPALVDPVHERIGSAKIDVLVERLLEIRAEGHRALVFSSFTGFLARVRERLEQESVTFTYLDGSTQRRSRVIEDFRTGDASAFLISLKAGGVGLTLTEADYVFVLDPWWNPATEAQAVDRAHRIGQERTVMVYRLVSTGTVEDKVMALKARKAALFAQVIDAEAGLSDTITAADIRALFD